jgi:antirestriction protein ArdC
MTRRRLTDAERDERRAANQRKANESVQALLTTDGWQRWVRTRARNGLSRYSLGNQLMIAHQDPDASYVAGFHAWLDLGYCVRKGEHAIAIMAPHRRKKDADDDDQPVYFRAVPVFDRAQVDALPDRDPTPLEPPCEPVTGDSHEALIAPLIQHAGELGYTVRWVELNVDGADGWCDHNAKEIVLRDGMPANAQVRTLAHEIAHGYGISYAEYTRGQAEVIVDTVAYIVCATVGLDVSGESIPYIAGWGDTNAADHARKFADVIHEIAKEIETAVADVDLEPEAVAA